jgi:hypothetical protein
MHLQLKGTIELLRSKEILDRKKQWICFGDGV